MSDVIPTADRNTPAMAKQKRRLSRKLSNAQAAALDAPMSKLTAAQCLLGMASVLFHRDGADRATRAFCERFGLPELPLREGALDLLRYCDRFTRGDGHEVGTEKKRVRRHNAHAYGLFILYAMKELSKRRDLHVVRQFATEGSDGPGRISMGAASTMWKSLDPKDKKHMKTSLKPFLDDFNARVAATGNGAGPSSGSGAHAELDVLTSYLQYEKAHPQLSILNLLRLVEVKELVGSGVAAAADAEALDVDNATPSDEGEESEAEEEEEEEEGVGKEVKSSSEAEDEGSNQKVEAEAEEAGTGTRSSSGSGSESSLPSSSPFPSSSPSSSSEDSDSSPSRSSSEEEEEEEEKVEVKPLKKRAKT